MEKTKPLSRGVDEIKDAPRLLEGRYGTDDMCNIWGTDANTYQAIMDAQVSGLHVLDKLYPGRLPGRYIEALRKTANLEAVKPEMVRAEEAITGHDVVAVNNVWGAAADAVEPNASSLVGLYRTSACSTETGKAVRCMRSFEVLAKSVENLRKI